MDYPPSHDRRDLTTAQDLTVTVTIQRGHVVVRALGVLDDGGAARVLAAVHCARQVSPTFIVDLSGLTGALPRGSRVLTHWWRGLATTGSTPLVIAPADAGLLPEVGSARRGERRTVVRAVPVSGDEGEEPVVRGGELGQVHPQALHHPVGYMQGSLAQRGGG